MEYFGYIEILFLLSVMALLLIGITKKKKAYKKEREEAAPDFPEDHELVFVYHKRIDLSMKFEDYYKFWKNMDNSKKNRHVKKIKKHILKGKLFPTYHQEEKVWVEKQTDDGTNLELIENNPPKVIWVDPAYAKKNKLIRADIKHKVYGI